MPTSIGYGASFNGSAALLAMLNSCAPGIAVVNVDNGSGAAALAHKIMNGSMRERARRIFRRMIEVEAGIHNIPVEQAHLHQLGALDTIADVVGVLLGFDLLGIQEIVVSPVPLGRGTLKTSHGQMPLPAPATVALLRGVPVVGVEHAIETVTPTAAALLTELASRFGPIPAMRLSAIGYGAGGRTTPVPNIVRILIGDAVESELIERETLVLLETNITALEAALIPVIEPILNPVWVFLFVGETPGRFALIGGADINRRRATSLK